MADIATWGALAFNLLSVSGFKTEAVQSYAVHKVVKGKPTLHNMGPENIEGTLKVRLFESIGDVQDQYDALIAAKDEGQSESLIWSNGISEGRFVIKGLKKLPIRTKTDGTLEFADIEIKFLEDPRISQSSNTRPRLSRATARIRAPQGLGRAAVTSPLTLAASLNTGSGIGGAAGAIDAARNAFGVSSAEAAQVIVGAAAGSASVVSRLREALPLIGPVAQAAGLDIRQATSVALPVLNAIDGRQAGREVAGIVRSFSQPDADRTSAFNNLNVMPDTRNLVGTMNALSAALDILPPEDSTESLNRVFRGSVAAGALIMDAAGRDDLSGTLSAINRQQVQPPISRGVRG
jgi:phage protein U